MIIVERIEGNLKKTYRYRFNENSSNFVLDSYFISVKYEGKRKYTDTHIYVRNPYNGFDRGMTRLQLKDIEVPEDVKQEVLNTFVSSITF